MKKISKKRRSEIAKKAWKTRKRALKSKAGSTSRQERRYERLLEKQAKIRYDYKQGIWSKDGRDVELAKIQKKIDKLTK